MTYLTDTKHGFEVIGNTARQIIGREFDIASGCPVATAGDMLYATAASSLERLSASRSIYIPIHSEPEISESTLTKIWERLYDRPAIVPCPYCHSHNAVTNPTCIQCGGPLGAK